MSIDIIRRQLHGIGTTRTRGRRPARLVIVGNVGNGNTGDEALLSVTLHALDADTSVTVVSRNPRRVSSLHAVAARPMTLTAAAGALADADGLIVVGGGMFGPGLPPLVRLLPRLVLAFAIAGRDTAFVAIGVYPGSPDKTLQQLRQCATRSRGITVRDTLSVETLNSPVPTPLVGDLAWHLPPAPADDARNLLQDVGADLTRPLLILAPKAGVTPEQTQLLVATCVAATRHWHEQGGTVAAIAFSDRADHGIDPRYTDASLITRIAEESGIPIPALGPNLPPALAKAITAEADAVFGLRYHALVFATAAGVACTSFAWEPKTQALMHQHDIPALTNSPVAALSRWLDNSISARLNTKG